MVATNFLICGTVRGICFESWSMGHWTCLYDFWKLKRCCFLFLWCERKFWEFVDVNLTKLQWLLRFYTCS